MEQNEIYHILCMHRLWELPGTGGKKANFSGCDLSGKDLRLDEAHKIISSYGKNIEIIKPGIKLNIFDNNLNSVDFSNANLTDANMMGVKLFSCNFSGADLTRTNFTGCDLRYSDFKNATFFGTNLRKSNLSGADCRGAELNRAIVNHTNINGIRVGKTGG